MALVSITEAAKLVRRGRATLYRDIEKGRLSKSVSASGESAIETSELFRVYGQLHLSETEGGAHETSGVSSGSDFKVGGVSPTHLETVSNASRDTSGDSAREKILEERVRSLERILVLEADFRKVKDQVTDELRARLADKDQVIKSLEGQVMLLEYTKPPADAKPRSFLERIIGIKQK